MFPISDSIKTSRFPVLNILVILITIFIFFKQITSSDPDSIILKYALIPARVDLFDSSTLYPFVTAIFLHGGFLHIASNMWFLYIFGDNVEDRLGFFHYLLLYFGAGIFGNVVQYVLMSDAPIPMLGASGAIAGILGAYYVLFSHSKIKTLIPIFIFPAIVEIPAPFMLGYWFLLQIISGTASLPLSEMQGGIAFWAHTAGFVFGLIFAKK